MAKVTKIPATKSKDPTGDNAKQKKRRVAAYARVSTELEEQISSYKAQVDYYTNYIKKQGNWAFVRVYTDEGKSGTGTKGRKGFNTMVSDALAGEIDLIITKSVSRFARNTVDSLTTIRKLKECGVEVYFEKENIFTFDGKGELLLTIMSSIAQEESRSISQNITWGKRKQFADGKAYVPYSRFLGYDRGPEGNLVVNEKEAVVVRRIYDMFLYGMTPYGIAKQLTSEGIPSPGRGKKWYDHTILSILQNEKYKGDALLQKRFTVDYLTKKVKKNEGEVPQYYVEGNHEAIVSAETFDMVRAELARRSQEGGHHSGARLFSGKVKCGHCGAWYGSKVWDSRNKYRKIVWQCNRKFENRCTTPHFSENELKRIFISAVNKLFARREELISEINDKGPGLLDTSSLEAEAKEKDSELKATVDSMKECLRKTDNREENRKQYDCLSREYDEISAELDSLKAQKEHKELLRTEMNVFVRELSALKGPVTSFNPELFAAITDSYIVRDRDDVSVIFKIGLEVKAAP